MINSLCHPFGCPPFDFYVATARSQLYYIKRSFIFNTLRLSSFFPADYPRVFLYIICCRHGNRAGSFLCSHERRVQKGGHFPPRPLAFAQKGKEILKVVEHARIFLQNHFASRRAGAGGDRLSVACRSFFFAVLHEKGRKARKIGIGGREIGILGGGGPDVRRPAPQKLFVFGETLFFRQPVQRIGMSVLPIGIPRSRQVYKGRDTDQRGGQFHSFIPQAQADGKHQVCPHAVPHRRPFRGHGALLPQGKDRAETFVEQCGMGQCLARPIVDGIHGAARAPRQPLGDLAVHDTAYDRNTILIRT